MPTGSQETAPSHNNAGHPNLGAIGAYPHLVEAFVYGAMTLPAGPVFTALGNLQEGKASKPRLSYSHVLKGKGVKGMVAGLGACTTMNVLISAAMGVPIEWSKSYILKKDDKKPDVPLHVSLPVGAVFLSVCEYGLTSAVPRFMSEPAFLTSMKGLNPAVEYVKGLEQQVGAAKMKEGIGVNSKSMEAVWMYSPQGYTQQVRLAQKVSKLLNGKAVDIESMMKARPPMETGEVFKEIGVLAMVRNTMVYGGILGAAAYSETNEHTQQEKDVTAAVSGAGCGLASAVPEAKMMRDFGKRRQPTTWKQSVDQLKKSPVAELQHLAPGASARMARWGVLSLLLAKASDVCEELTEPQGRGLS